MYVRPQYVPVSSTASLIVAVRVRPLLRTEQARGNKKDIIRVLDDRVVVVLDPDESKARGPRPGDRGGGGGRVVSLRVGRKGYLRVGEAGWRPQEVACLRLGGTGGGGGVARACLP